MFRKALGFSCLASSHHESGFKFVSDALRNRRGIGVIDQVQICGESFGCSKPVHDFREQMPIEFRQVAFAQLQQLRGYLRPPLSQFCEPRE